MPIYEYQCEQCAHRLEALQKISDDPLQDCPECNQASLKKLLSAASFRLKGAGWYETDFKTGDKKQLAESDSAASKESKKGSEEGSTKDNTKEGTDTKKASAEAKPSKSEKSATKSESKSAKSESSSSTQKKAS
ncbi:MAG: zinc ribbon domain-containing protein [Pseudomonadales bacterium]|nr:zinc ribbon domain-containing protein [Pseudomonadales bacterium]